MDIYVIIAVFTVNLVYTFIKSLQQQFVIHNKKLFILPNSMAMAACETFMISTIAAVVIKTGSMWVFLPAGAGAATGALIGMTLYQHYFSKEPK